MKKTALLLSGAFLAVTLLGSCKKNGNTTPAAATGTPGTTTGYVNGAPITDPTSTSSPKIKYQLKAVNTSATLRTTASGKIQWTSGSVNATMVKFEATKNATEVEYRTTNSGQIDLMSPTSIYFGNFSLPAGTYSEVELKIYLEKGTAASLQLNGQFSNSSITIPVSLLIDESLELKTEQSDISFVDNSSFTALTTFDLSGLTAGITEPMITGASLTGGTLMISASSNTSLYNIILNNFRNKKHHSEVDKD